jgi:hypothetical protein
MARPRFLAYLLVGFQIVVGFAAGVESVPPGRLTGMSDGIEYEYSPGQEELARLLCGRFSEHNSRLQPQPREIAADLADATLPLSAAEMKANRSVYLQRIASLLALPAPTALQEECYDEFVHSYEAAMRQHAIMRDMCEDMRRIRRFTLWDRDALAERLEAGENINGLALDANKRIRGQFGSQVAGVGAGLKDFAHSRGKLRREYRLSVGQQNGVTIYRASVSRKRWYSWLPATADSVAKTSPAPDHSTPFPVIVTADIATLPPVELAQRLWEGLGKKSVAAMLQKISEVENRLPLMDEKVAFIILHETTEIGIVDHYYRGKDRRWFCDGIANYIPWRVVRDVHGESTANLVYDLEHNLKRHERYRENANLRKWPAAERQSERDTRSPLETARYTFAANAVFIMNARAGEDILPRLFAEIGKTRPRKVSMQTVEKAWTKLAGSKLDTVLLEAVKPTLHVRSVAATH